MAKIFSCVKRNSDNNNFSFKVPLWKVRKIVRNVYISTGRRGKQNTFDIKEKNFFQKRIKYGQTI